MEKAILKTLVYADIFRYPLKGYEVLKWLVFEETTLLKVESGLNRLIKKRKIQYFSDLYFLPKNKNFCLKRKRSEKYSKILLNKALIFSHILKIIPWIKLVGISGGLALSDADLGDDIDFFIITSQRRIWISRLLANILLDAFRVRRKAGMSKRSAKGKICLNTFLDEENLEQQFKDLYVAHEVLQMKVLWQREGIYSKYLSDNNWVFKFLPNWTSKIKYKKSKVKSGTYIFDYLENLTKLIQLKVMRKPTGLERIGEGSLYFYPEDYREQILKIYQKKIRKL